MIKSFFYFFLFFCSVQSFSQSLSYKSNGNILNSENEKISPVKMRELLATNEKMLVDYNAGRSKKTVGNVLLIGGSALIVTDLITALTAKIDLQNGSEKGFPTALTYVGVAALIIAIPVKIGFSKKIKNVVSEYNNNLKVGSTEFKLQKAEFITNINGAGLRLSFN
jgi:hypothetical protein